MSFQTIQTKYEHTICAACFGYITQAIVNNFVPLLFLTFQSQYGISLDKIGLLVTINFGVQLLVDFLAAKFVDRIGYRTSIVAAHVLAGLGLAGLAVFPGLLQNAYVGMILCVICYAIGGGIIEVLVSPIVEACPTKKKEAVMSLLHSFYCWGHVFVVLMSTLFFFCAGIENWKWLALLWAVLPFANAVYFLFVPISMPGEEGNGMSILQLLKNRTFWVFCLLMLCAGASEQGMSQWASAFAEAGLKVSKTIGDLAGPCAFAVFMGTARILYSKCSDRIGLRAGMAGSCVLCIISYLLASLSANPVIGLIGCALCGFSVGILWPGTFSMASSAMPTGGTAMFAFLALAGDMGCSVGPTVVGLVSEALGSDLKRGILSAVIFPAALLVTVLAVKLKKKRNMEDEV